MPEPGLPKWGWLACDDLARMQRIEIPRGGFQLSGRACDFKQQGGAHPSD
jgi:hypothetical protein